MKQLAVQRELVANSCSQFPCPGHWRKSLRTPRLGENRGKTMGRHAARASRGQFVVGAQSSAGRATDVGFA